jgi:hypothetical protein
MDRFTTLRMIFTFKRINRRFVIAMVAHCKPGLIMSATAPRHGWQGQRVMAPGKRMKWMKRLWGIAGIPNKPFHLKKLRTI